MSSPSSRRPGPARRRQRTTRLWVAALVLAGAALIVLAAVLSGSTVFVAIAAALAVGLGAAATRITYAEVVHSRREAARDRAQQAQDYLALTQVRIAEQAAYVSDTNGRLARHQTRIQHLQGCLDTATADLAEARTGLDAEQARADGAEATNRSLSRRLDDAEDRAAQAIVRVAELEQELDVVLAEWQAGTSAPRRKHA